MDVTILVPPDGVSAICAPGVVVVPGPQGNSEAGFCAELYVVDMLNG